jgi:hypothetical protein
MYFNNATPLQPHTYKLREAANKLWDAALRKADCNETAQAHVYDPAEIANDQDIAAQLERWSLVPIEFSVTPACPFGLAMNCNMVECYCRTAARVRAMEPDDGCICIDGSCPACQKRAEEIWTL